MEIRRRNVGGLRSPDRGPTEFLQTLDVFPKLPDDCKKATTGGGAITLVTAILCILLIFSEISNYVKSKYEYSYEVDKDFDTNVQINIDLTVATKCEYTSLDLLDVTGSSMSSEGKVRYRKTMFRLPEKNRLQFERRRLLANVLRSNHHVLPDMLWKRDHLLRSESLFGTTSAGSDDGLVPTGRLEKYDACHVVGTLFVRKVAGNMHLIPGKAITGPGGMHLHISPFLDLTAYNFSHRINHLSFGVHIANRVGPLDAVEEVALSPMETFQYYLSIVPTRIVYTFSTSDTYQYAVTMKNRSANHNQGNQDVPGIFFTYETFPLLVKVTESRELFGTFLARLAALVGGLFATVGLIRQAICGLPELLLWHTRIGRRCHTTWSRLKQDWSLLSNGAVNQSAPLIPESPT